MTENTYVTEPTAGAYERLRDTAEGTVGVEWRDADRWEAGLRESYARIGENEALSEEGKTATAQRAFEHAAPRIAKARAAAREEAIKEARKHEEKSIPIPGKSKPSTLYAQAPTNTSELQAAQAETALLLEQVRHRQSRAKGGMDTSDVATDVLRESYARALEQGGVVGRATALGCLRACEYLGIDAHNLVEPFRSDEHREDFEKAQQYEYLAATIPPEDSIPAVPFGNARRVNTGGDFHTTSTGAKLLRPRTKKFVQTKKNPRKQNPWRS
jgi:hypothetical protein